MSNKSNEIKLDGGQMTPGVVRVGETVRRPLSQEADASFRHNLLQLLHDQEFNFAPKFLGIDDQGREILSYLDGQVGYRSSVVSPESLVEVAQALRQFHDITANSTLIQGHEVVCHNDLAPWNTIFADDGSLVGFIDFDAAAPGDRLDDLGYMAWTFLDLGSNSNIPWVEQNLSNICKEYGLTSNTGLAEAILKQQQRVLSWRSQMAIHSEDPKLRQYSADRVTLIKKQMAWVEQNRQIIEG